MGYREKLLTNREKDELRQDLRCIEESNVSRIEEDGGLLNALIPRRLPTNWWRIRWIEEDWENREKQNESYAIEL